MSGSTVQPPYKWVGGKRALVPLLCAHVARWARVNAPDGKFTYVEPFLGGGALALALMPAYPNARFVLSDINPGVVDVWALAQDAAAWHNLVGVAEAWADLYNNAAPEEKERRYYALRTAYNQLTEFHALRFMLLLKLCFNGRWRENAKGGMNSPWNKAKEINFDAVNLCSFGELLRSRWVEVRREGYVDACQRIALSASQPHLFYFDPPYAPTRSTANFTSYSAVKFDLAMQRALHTRAWRCAQTYGVIASNADTPFVRELWLEGNGWKLNSAVRSGRVSCKGAGRAAVAELIITSF